MLTLSRSTRKILFGALAVALLALSFGFATKSASAGNIDYAPEGKYVSESTGSFFSVYNNQVSDMFFNIKLGPNNAIAFEKRDSQQLEYHNLGGANGARWTFYNYEDTSVNKVNNCVIDHYGNAECGVEVN